MTKWILVLITWYTPEVGVERTELSFNSLEDCNKARAALIEKFEDGARQHSGFGYVFDECKEGD